MFTRNTNAYFSLCSNYTNGEIPLCFVLPSQWHVSTVTHSLHFAFSSMHIFLLGELTFRIFARLHCGHSYSRYRWGSKTNVSYCNAMYCKDRLIFLDCLGSWSVFLYCYGHEIKGHWNKDCTILWDTKHCRTITFYSPILSHSDPSLPNDITEYAQVVIPCKYVKKYDRGWIIKARVKLWFGWIWHPLYVCIMF